MHSPVYARQERPAIWAIVPIKEFDASKNRLAKLLNASERFALMLAMARDVLSALAESSRLAGILVVSRSPEAHALAGAAGAELYAETGNADLPRALEEGAVQAQTRFGAEGIFVVPADVPLIDPDEIDAILSKHRQVTILPDSEKVGTNGLICTPPDAIPLVFDGKSFESHRRSACNAGITPLTVTNCGFSLDVDRPCDLKRLIPLGPQRRTGAYLESSGIARRLDLLPARAD